MQVNRKLTKQILSWSLYDWANSVFATSIVAVFFPIFFKNYWAVGLSPSESSFYLGTALSLIALVFALVAPFFGSFADLGCFAEKGVFILAFSGSLSCLMLYFISDGHWIQALLIYALAWFCFSGSNLLYDSTLLKISDNKTCHWISGLGYALGYLGGGFLLVINALMVFNPLLFGLESRIEATRWVFVSVGLWWFFFTWPFLFWVKPRLQVPVSGPSRGETEYFSENSREKFRWTKTGFYKKFFLTQGKFNPFSGFKQVFLTFRKIRKDQNLFLFLGAYFFYIDGVYTIYKMAVDFALSIGLKSGDLIKAVIIVQFVGFPATLAFSYLAQKKGVKKGILTGLFIYALVCFGGVFISTPVHFYILAFILGLVQGTVQALSRSLYSRLIPKEKPGEYFGFYNMFGKFSAILGPFLMGFISQMTGNPRLSLLGVLALFLIGGLLFVKVREFKDTFYRS